MRLKPNRCSTRKVEYSSSGRSSRAADECEGAQQCELVGHVAEARLHCIAHRRVQPVEPAEQCPAQQHRGAEGHAQQAETSLGKRVVGRALVRFKADAPAKRRGHAIAVPGHVAHLARREPEPDEHRGEQRGSKGQGKREGGCGQ